MTSAAPESDLVLHFPPAGAGWASQVIHAFRTQAISAGMMWDVLLAHADRDDDGPNVGNLLAHLRDAYEDRRLAIERELDAAEDDIVVMSGEDDAA